MANLTDRMLSVLKVEPGRKDKLIFDRDCKGLGLRVTSAGSKVFIIQWTDPATKRKNREKLGVWGSITIEQARVAARIRLGEVAKGIDLRAEREKKKIHAEQERAEAALTFDALITEWAGIHLSGRSENYRVEAQRAIRLAFSAFLKRSAARITKADAVRVLDGLVQDGKSAMAASTLAYARAAFSWAQKRGKVPSNPFQNLPIATKSGSRDRVLTEVEVRAFWVATGTLFFPWGPFYRLAALTLQRREEVSGMRWSEISDDLSTWSIPASRMKNGKAHDVYLTMPAQNIVRNLPHIKGHDLVFTTTGKTPISGFSRAKITLDKAMAEHMTNFSPWRLHDLRRTGVSTLAKLGFDSIVADKLLAHQPSKLQGVAAVYQRHDFAKEQAQALEAWSAYLVRQDAGAKVIKLERQA